MIVWVGLVIVFLRVFQAYSHSISTFVLLPVIVFYSRIALADPSNRMLNSHVALVPDLHGNASGASLLGKVLALVLRCDIKNFKISNLWEVLFEEREADGLTPHLS